MGNDQEDRINAEILRIDNEIIISQPISCFSFVPTY
jgi:hypothetical protein